MKIKNIFFITLLAVVFGHQDLSAMTQQEELFLAIDGQNTQNFTNLIKDGDIDVNTTLPATTTNPLLEKFKGMTPLIAICVYVPICKLKLPRTPSAFAHAALEKLFEKEDLDLEVRFGGNETEECHQYRGMTATLICAHKGSLSGITKLAKRGANLNARVNSLALSIPNVYDGARYHGYATIHLMIERNSPLCHLEQEALDKIDVNQKIGFPGITNNTPNEELTPLLLTATLLYTYEDNPRVNSTYTPLAQISIMLLKMQNLDVHAKTPKNYQNNQIAEKKASEILHLKANALYQQNQNFEAKLLTGYGFHILKYRNKTYTYTKRDKGERALFLCDKIDDTIMSSDNLNSSTSSGQSVACTFRLRNQQFLVYRSFSLL